MSRDASHEPLTTEQLFRQHAGFVARFLSRLGVPDGQIEDAVQEVFLVVHRNGGYRPGIAKPTSYLANLAIHAASKHRRREARDRQRRSDAALDHLPSDERDPGHARQVEQDLERLQLALERLPEELRTTLLLVEVEGESCVSVAAALSWPVGTVYWRLHQARKKLQSALKTLDSERAGARREAAPAAQLERRPLTNLAVIMSFGGESSFQASEAGRLLRLAREQPGPNLALDALLAQHLELVRAGAQLPAWAASYVPHATTWVSLIGTGPIVACVAGASVVVAITTLEPEREPPAPPAQRIALTQPAAAPRSPAQPEASPAEVEPPRTADGRASAGAERSAEQMPSSATAASADKGAADVRTPESVRASNERVRSRAMTRAEHDTPDEASGESELSPRPASQQPQRSQQQQQAPLQHPQQALPQKPQPQQLPPQQPQPGARGSGELAEMQGIAEAEQLLATDPARALAISRQLRVRFPQGYLVEERAYVEVMALLELGRTAEARAKADAFLRAYPDGPYSRRVRDAAASSR